MRLSRRTGKPPLVPVWQRWAWFRLGALEQCQRWPRTTAQLRDLLGVERRARHVQLRNQRNMVRHGFLIRTEDGYLATARGRRVLADIDGLELTLEAG
jgi:hypothetical protein